MKYALYFFLTFVTGISFSQEFNFENYRHINVQGISTMEVIPDQIKVKVVLAERYKGKNKVELKIIEYKFNQILKNFAINESDVTLDKLTSSLQYYKKRSKDVLATKYYFVDFIDLTTAASFMAELSKADIATNIFSKSHSKILEYRKEVKKAALIAAMDKASYLLESAGEKRGEILRLIEIPSDDNNRYQKYQEFLSSSNSYIKPEGLVGVVQSGLAPIVISFGMDVTFAIVD